MFSNLKIKIRSDVHAHANTHTDKHICFLAPHHTHARKNTEKLALKGDNGQLVVDISDVYVWSSNMFAHARTCLRACTHTLA